MAQGWPKGARPLTTRLAVANHGVMDARLESALFTKRFRTRVWQQCFVPLWLACVLAMLLSIALGYFDLEPITHLLFAFLPGLFAGLLCLVSFLVLHLQRVSDSSSGADPEPRFPSVVPTKLRKPPRPPGAA